MKNIEPNTTKWQRTTTARLGRKKSSSWVPNGQLYKEIGEGYRYFLGQRMKAGAMRR